MLSVRETIAATMVSMLAATAGGAATAQVPSSDAQRKATVGVSILPGIIGPGNGVQSPGSAKWAVIGKYDASKEGKKAILQRLSGTSWVTADKGKIERRAVSSSPCPRGSAGAP